MTVNFEGQFEKRPSASWLFADLSRALWGSILDQVWLSCAAVRSWAHIIACHVKIRLYRLNTPPTTPLSTSRACVLSSPTWHVSALFFLPFLELEWGNIAADCAYHYLTKHSLQEYLPYPLYQHDMSPHARRLTLSTQAQHLLGMALRSNHDSLEWNASNITDAKFCSEQRCMCRAWPHGTHLHVPPNQNKLLCHYISWLHGYIFYFIYCQHQSCKNEACRWEQCSHDGWSSFWRLCATCSNAD